MLKLSGKDAGSGSVKGLLFVLLVLCLLATSDLLAQAAESVLSPEAQKAFDRGMAAAGQNEWRLAIKYFTEAREAAPEDPEILFNLALAYDKANAPLPAAVWFKAYITINPEAQNASQVRERIDELLIKYEATVWKLIESTEKMISNTLEEVEGAGINTGYMYQSMGELLAARVKMGDIDGAEQLATTWKLEDQPYERRDELYRSLTKALACVGKLDAAKKYSVLVSPTWTDPSQYSKGFMNWQKTLTDETWKESWGSAEYEFKAWNNFFTRLETFNNYTIKSPEGIEAVHDFPAFWKKIEKKDPVVAAQEMSKAIHYMAAAWDYFQRMEKMWENAY